MYQSSVEANSNFEFDNRKAVQEILAACAVLNALISDARAIVASQQYKVRFDVTKGAFNGKIQSESANHFINAFLDLMAFVDAGIPDFLGGKEELEKQISDLEHQVSIAGRARDNYKENFEYQRKRADDLQTRVSNARVEMLKLLEGITAIDVTHSERRGQLKLFADQFHKAIQEAIYPPDDIPF